MTVRDERAPPEGPLRILEMSTIFHVGGITRHVIALGDWLRARGHQVSFAGSPGAWLNPTIDPDFISLDVHGVSGEKGDSGILKRVGKLAATALALRRRLKAHPVDVIHAHESAPALVARVATLGMGVPIAVTYHGSAPGRVGQFGAVTRRAADRVIAVSRRSAEDLATRGGVPRAKLQVVGLGLDTPPPVDPARVEALRRQLLGDHGKLLFVTVARLAEQKGIDVLIQVARRVTAKRPDIHFSVVGDGPLDGTVQGWAHDAGVPDHVHFLGRSNEPQLHLAAADAFLLTSRWEALPFTIAEAFQQGAPAIATDCGGVAELIDETVGRVLPVGDADGLAAAVLALAEDADLRRSMAAAARLRGREARFTHDFNNRQLEAVYQDLAGTARRSRNRSGGS